MPIIDFILGIVITVLVVILIYKDGKVKETRHNLEFVSNELTELTKKIHIKDEEIEKLKKIDSHNNVIVDIEII